MSNAKKTMPWIPVGHPEYKWTSGADVQATWRKYGWVAPSGQVAAPLVREAAAPVWVAPVRRVK